MADDLKDLLKDPEDSQELDEEIIEDDGKPPWEEDDTPVESESVEDDSDAVDDSADVVSVDENIVDLRKDKMTAFLKILNMLREPCEDMVVENGKICQITNKKTCIYEIDADELFGNSSFMMSGVNQKYSLLEPFVKQEVDVFLEIKKHGYEFRDSISKMTFSRPHKDHMENHFISKDVLSSKLKTKDSRVFEFDFEKNVLLRLGTYSKTLTATTIRLEFKDEKASFNIQAADNTATTKINLVELKDELDITDIEGYVTFSIPTFQSFINSGITEIKAILHEREEKGSFVIELKADLKITDDSGSIPISAWMIGELKPF